MWRDLLKDKNFLLYYLSISLYSLTAWLNLGLIPLFIYDRFGSGSELVLSLGARLVPRILGAPISAVLIEKLGTKRSMIITMIASPIFGHFKV